MKYYIYRYSFPHITFVNAFKIYNCKQENLNFMNLDINQIFCMNNSLITDLIKLNNTKKI